MLGTLGRQGNPDVLRHLQAMLERHGCTHVTVLLSEVFPAKLAAFADEGGLAVAVDPLAAAERGDQLVGHLKSERLQVVQCRLQVFFPDTGKGIGDDGDDGGAAARLFRRRAVLVMDGLGKQHRLAKPKFGHGSLLQACGSVFGNVA